MCYENGWAYLAMDKKIGILEINSRKYKQIETKEYINNKIVYIENIRLSMLN